MLLTEGVRAGLRRQLSARYVDESRCLRAVFVAPAWEEQLINGVRVSNTGRELAVDPAFAERVLDALGRELERADVSPVVLLCRQDARRHLRTLIEHRFWTVPVLTFQELMPDLQIERLATLGQEFPEPVRAEAG